jgi:CRP-like cAMP-binding protein
MRSRHTADHYLQSIPAFSACSAKQIAHIARLVEAIDLPAGDVVVQQGSVGQEAFILASGSAEVIRDGEVIATLSPGAHFGELSLLDPAPRNASVRMTAPGRVLSLSPRVFFTLLQDVPGLVESLLTGLAQRAHADDERTHAGSLA